MERADYAPVAVGGLLVVAVLSAVSVVGVGMPTGAPSSSDCDVESRPASVSVADLPGRATVEQRRFDGGSRVRASRSRVEDVRRRPTVAHKLRANVSERARAVAPTAVLGRCCDTIDTTRIGTEDALPEPDRVGNVGAYDGRFTVTDRGTRDGDRVSRELAGGNVTAVVRG
jgi:hypothetical protein